MAFWTRRNGKVYVYQWDKAKRRQKTVPRKNILQLDGQPDEVIDRYVASLEPKPLHRQPIADGHLTKLVEDFCQYQIDRGLNPHTVYMKRVSLLDHVVPFFLAHEPPLKDPNTWTFRAVRMLEHFQTVGLSSNLTFRANTALKGFWTWMQDEGVVDAAINLRLRRPRIVKNATPLQYALTPDEVLTFARSASPDMAFIALTGYFFSLRTQETLALTKNDFRAGTKASELECGKVMHKAGLFNRFAVNVDKQNAKSTGDKKAKPKANSKGWVACFNAEAARMIVTLINELALERKDDTLVKFTVDYNLHRWQAKGIRNITMKDLRRASIYWLGHHTGLGIIELKSHARHQRTDTTALYLRRPEETLAQMDDLDLDA